MDLIVCISGEERSYSHGKKLIEKGEWERIIVIGDEKGRKFSCSKKIDHIILDSEKPSTELIPYLLGTLKGKIQSFDVGLNLVSGTGKEHMVILASLLKLGVGVRLVALTADGILEL